MRIVEQESVFTLLNRGPLRVGILGSGNWGCAVARVTALNTKDSYLFEDVVKMWTLEETLSDGRLLSHVINNEHENVKYLPNVKLPENLLAVTDIIEVVKDADLLIIIVPHQFVSNVCDKMIGHIKPSARAVTFVKGLDIKNGIPNLFSDIISEKLNINCDAVSGANVAKDVAIDQFCESTLGYTESETAFIWQSLFDRPSFRIQCIPDVAGVQVCGAIKNMIAMAAGFCDGMNLGTNTKSAILRIGMLEMKDFATTFFNHIMSDTFFESAGLADLITTCFGGRNVKCAAEFIIRGKNASWESIEKDLLNGQKMQGQLTCKEVQEVLIHFNLQKRFPLFNQVYEIAFNHADPKSLLTVFMEAPIAKIRNINDCVPCVSTKNILSANSTSTTPNSIQRLPHQSSTPSTIPS